MKNKLKSRGRHLGEIIFFSFGSILLFVFTVSVFWATQIEIPDFDSFDERKVANSTKIYDRTGDVLLYDVNRDVRRTVIPFEEMGDNIKEATVAIEDREFYNHIGIRPTSIVRAVLVNLTTGSFSQGGSTITQQIVKNTLLTQEKSITRKIKEIILAIKVERSLSKDQILSIYLNEAPYGGVIYGIQEASQSFFDKDPKDLTIAESAYLAAIPQAPTYYSPRGNHRDALENRKNLVLSKMLEVGYITEEEFNTAKNEVVVFAPQEPSSIKAPHFVFMVKEYLEEKYGKDMVESGGLKVITTLDWDIQKEAEVIVKESALKNESDWNASNQSAVVIDPKTGQILSLVGSRDYFDKEIDGSFNIATAFRQPGSSFKPFVYATAFKKGYTPETVLFDVPTEFNTSCSPFGVAISTSQDRCYMPDNYDGSHVGPINLRNALAQSRNVPAVKLLYLAGIDDSIRTARELGITSLGDADVYGLTLVLGGGEVSLLDMTSAYGVFATSGTKNKHTPILSVTSKNGEVLETFAPKPEIVLERNVANMINSILSDNIARTPLFGSSSFLYFPGYDVAGKTGTTNNNRDAWLVGYTTNAVVGVWSGNNDNTPMKKGSSISGSTFNKIMNETIKKYGAEKFEQPTISYPENTPPIIKGLWQGGESFTIDKISGKLATELTPEETKEDRVLANVHDILYWINKENPLVIRDPGLKTDSQYYNWETALQNWWVTHGGSFVSGFIYEKPTSYDDVHVESRFPEVSVNTDSNSFSVEDLVYIEADVDSYYTITSVDFFLNGSFIGTDTTYPYKISFIPKNFESVSEESVLSVVVTDEVFNRGEGSLSVSFY